MTLKRWATVWFAVIVLVLVTSGTLEDYRSCGRQQEPRRLLREQLHDQVELQTALSAWDDRSDKRLVQIDGGWFSLSRPQLREWFAERTSARAARSEIDCKSFPAGQ